MDQTRGHGRRPKGQRVLWRAAPGNGRDALDRMFEAISVRIAQLARFADVFMSGSPLRSDGTLNKRTVVCNTCANMPVF
jgi:hypothetical protein